LNGLFLDGWTLVPFGERSDSVFLRVLTKTRFLFLVNICVLATELWPYKQLSNCFISRLQTLCEYLLLRLVCNSLLFTKKTQNTDKQMDQQQNRLTGTKRRALPNDRCSVKKLRGELPMVRPQDAQVMAKKYPENTAESKVESTQIGAENPNINNTEVKREQLIVCIAQLVATGDLENLKALFETCIGSIPPYAQLMAKIEPLVQKFQKWFLCKEKVDIRCYQWLNQGSSRSRAVHSDMGEWAAKNGLMDVLLWILAAVESQKVPQHPHNILANKHLMIESWCRQVILGSGIEILGELMQMLGPSAIVNSPARLACFALLNDRTFVVEKFNLTCYLSLADLSLILLQVLELGYVNTVSLLLKNGAEVTNEHLEIAIKNDCYNSVQILQIEGQQKKVQRMPPQQAQETERANLEFALNVAAKHNSTECWARLATQACKSGNRDLVRVCLRRGVSHDLMLWGMKNLNEYDIFVA